MVEGDGGAEEFPPQLGDAFFQRLVLKAKWELLRVGAREADPVDVAMQALLELYKRWKKGTLDTTDPDALVRGLGGTIVGRRAIDARRRRAARPEVAAPHEESAKVGTPAALDAFPGTGTRSSARDRRLDARERVGRIPALLAKRPSQKPDPDGDLELLVLARADGYSFAEIAARRARGETAETVRLLLRRIERWLRENLDPPDAS